MVRFEVYATAIVSAEVEAESEDAAWQKMRQHVLALNTSTDGVSEFNISEVEQDEMNTMDDVWEDDEEETDDES